MHPGRGRQTNHVGQAVAVAAGSVRQTVIIACPAIDKTGGIDLADDVVNRSGGIVVVSGDVCVGPRSV